MPSPSFSRRSQNPKPFAALRWGVLTAWVCLLAACGGEAREVPEAVRVSRERGCMACHGMLRKQVGPGFAQIADRYRDDSSAPSRLAGRIRSGSVGVWGRVIMPQQAHVSEAEALLLAEWVLAQRGAGGP